MLSAGQEIRLANSSGEESVRKLKSQKINNC